MVDPGACKRGVVTAAGPINVVSLESVVGENFRRLPHVIRLLAINHFRVVGPEKSIPMIQAVKARAVGDCQPFEFVFRPSRLLMHDTTCTPALVDIAAMRDVVAENGGNPLQLDPTLPVAVSVDHSLAVDQFATNEALKFNRDTEFTRNVERYGFMKWAAENLKKVDVYPPGTGIMHTINLEQLATLLEITSWGEAFPDTLLGTDSHTPMIGGIGVLGWGVGGLEAEMVMLGDAVALAMPEVVGVELLGALPSGVMATDLALEITHQLRNLGVSGSFVEFFGPGCGTLTAGERAVIANMAPEYGASTGHFPVDGGAVAFLEATGRPLELTRSIEPAYRAMGLWYEPEERPNFDRTIRIDLSSLSPVVSGPRRPQDKLLIPQVRGAIEKAIARPLKVQARPHEVPDGAVGIAAITSCTNTTEPRLLIAAGLVARRACALGIKPPRWVKTSLAPGSPSAAAYLSRCGLLSDLEAVGFAIVGYGCTTCIGNSGPLPDVVVDAIGAGKAITAVLSGNRNFPGRVHPLLDLGILASPPLVVAYALKGDVTGDLQTEVLGRGANGEEVYLRDLWPKQSEIDAALKKGYRAEDVSASFRSATQTSDWAEISVTDGEQYPWAEGSRYLRRPPFVKPSVPPLPSKLLAVPLMVLGDDITTDHISPAGAIDPASEAGQWLIERGGDPTNLNTFAAYRGNWEVMMRGLFTNKQVINYLGAKLISGETLEADGSQSPVWQAGQRLLRAEQPAVLFAGERYGMGSSRDWAAKGAALLGVRIVVARSIERIHRTNLIGMGILPFEIADDFIPAEHPIKPSDRLECDFAEDGLVPGAEMSLILRNLDDQQTVIRACLAAHTQQEIETLKAGGMLPKILQSFLKSIKGPSFAG